MSTVTAALTPPPTKPEASRPASRIALVIVSKYGTVFAMAIMILIFGLAVPNGAFLRTTNLLAIVNQSALTAIIASGLTLVLVVGEMDLSIGYGASLAGIIVTGLMLNQGLPMPVAILVTVAMGALIGAVNGTLVTKAGVNAVVATLGVGTVLIGLSYGYTAGSPIISVPKGFTDLTLGRLGGIQNPIWYMPGNPGRVVGRAEPHSAGAAHAGGGCQQERGPTGWHPHRSGDDRGVRHRRQLRSDHGDPAGLASWQRHCQCR
jgi:ribose transport system permease protein